MGRVSYISKVIQIDENRVEEVDLIPCQHCSELEDV